MLFGLTPGLKVPMRPKSRPIRRAIAAHHRAGHAGRAVVLPGLNLVLPGRVVDEDKVRLLPLLRRSPFVQGGQAVPAHLFQPGMLVDNLDGGNSAEGRRQAVLQFAPDLLLEDVRQQTMPGHIEDDAKPIEDGGIGRADWHS
jgi:hypothetical protein